MLTNRNAALLIMSLCEKSFVCWCFVLFGVFSMMTKITLKAEKFCLHLTSHNLASSVYSLMFPTARF